MAREVLRAGTAAGLAMMPFGALFRFFGLRVNEYGRKVLDLFVGDVSGPLQVLLTFVQHLVISWVAAVPLLLLLAVIDDRRIRLVAGAVYGAGFYVVMNSLALPIAFGDPTPWQLGFSTVYPSLTIHLVYGIVIAMVARPRTQSRSDARHLDRAT